MSRRQMTPRRRRELILGFEKFADRRLKQLRDRDRAKHVKQRRRCIVGQHDDELVLTELSDETMPYTITLRK